MAIKLADTLAPMADFPAAMAEHVEFSDGKSLQEKYDLGELGGEGGGGHIELTQAEYDALTDEEKLNGAIYFITDAEGGSSGIVDDKIDTSSTNPVQNKVLAQEIARAETGKQYLKITGPMPRGTDYLYASTIRYAIENGSALGYQGVDIETIETNMQDNISDILYRYKNAGNKKYTATEGLSLNIVPQDTCIIFEAEDVPSDIDKYEVILEWFEPPFIKVYSSEKEFDPVVAYGESDYNFYDLTDLEGRLTSIFNDMGIKSELNIKNHNFDFDLNQDGDEETLKVNLYKLQKDFAGNGILTVELEDGRILTSTRTKGYNASWSAWEIKEPETISKVYTSLAELGLTADATLDDVIAKLGVGQSATLTTTDFTNYQTLFPYSEEQDAYATVHIEKGYDVNGSRTIVKWIKKDASKLAYGGLSSNNKVAWWNEYALKSYVDSKVVTPVLKAVAGSNINTVGTPSVTANTSGNETTFTFNNLKGAAGGKGDTGTRGSMWYRGTGITGTSTTATVFSGSGVSSALVNDMYLNTSTGYIYQCTVAGNASAAKWVYIGSLKGANGTTPTIKAAAGSNINTVGTPSVTASTSGTTTTFTFNNLKGAKGDKGDAGTQYTITTSTAEENINKEILVGTIDGHQVYQVTYKMGEQTNSTGEKKSYKIGYPGNDATMIEATGVINDGTVTFVAPFYKLDTGEYAYLGKYMSQMLLVSNMKTIKGALVTVRYIKNTDYLT